MTNIKTINVDFDSLEECEKLAKRLKTVICDLKTKVDGFQSKKQKMQIIFDACNSIFDTNISKVYINMKLDPTPKYYVYAHCDPAFKIAINK